jgi:hypothetical protein
MSQVMKDTADIRAKLLDIWKRIDDKTITSSEARLHISMARAVLDTLKVEMAAAHLAQQQIPAVPIAPWPVSRAARLRDQ